MIGNKMMKEHKGGWGSLLTLSEGERTFSASQNTQKPPHSGEEPEISSHAGMTDNHKGWLCEAIT